MRCSLGSIFLGASALLTRKNWRRTFSISRPDGKTGNKYPLIGDFLFPNACLHRTPISISGEPVAILMATCPRQRRASALWHEWVLQRSNGRSARLLIGKGIKARFETLVWWCSGKGWPRGRATLSSLRKLQASAGPFTGLSKLRVLVSGRHQNTQCVWCMCACFL